MPIRTLRTVSILFLCLILNLGSLLRAQEESSFMAPDAIESRIKNLEAGGSTATADDVASTVAAYQEALTLTKDKQASAAKLAEYQRMTADVPVELENLGKRNAGLTPEEQPPSELGDSSVQSLTQRFDTTKTALAAVRAEIEAHGKAEKLRNERLESLPGLVATATAQLSELPAATAPLGTAPELERARHQRLLARRALLQQQIDTFQAELDYYGASAALFSAQGGFANQRLSVLAESAETWQTLIDSRRLTTKEAEATQAVADLKRVTGVPGAEAIAQENVELTRFWTQSQSEDDGLSRRMADASATLSDLEALYERQKSEHAGATKRVKVLEDAKLQIDPTTGQLLRQLRQKLGKAHQLREQLRTVLSASAQAQIDLIFFEDRQAEILATSVSELSPEHVSLAEKRVNHLKALVDDNRSHIATLSATATVLRNLSKQTREFALFVDQRLLWLQSTARLSLDDFSSEAAAVQNLLSPNPFEGIASDIRNSPIPWILSGVILVVLLFRRKTYVARLTAFGAAARKRNCTSYVPTAKAFAHTLLIAAPFPAALWFVYARSSGLSAGVPVGVAEGIRNMAGFLTATILFLVIAHPAGLMVDHFRISKERAGLLRTNFHWFIPALLPLVFFATALPRDVDTTSAGRLFFVAILVILMVFFYRILLPSKCLIHWRGKAPNRVAKVCFALGIAAPAALIIGAAAGYYASVQELRARALVSVWLILLTLLIVAMLYRWILVSRRRLAIQQALKRRAAALAERKNEDPDKTSNPQNVTSPAEVASEALKVVTVEEQTSRLVRAGAIAAIAFGLWGVWLPTVPALSALDKVTLWSDDTAAALIPDGSGDQKIPTALSNPVSDATGTLASTTATKSEQDGVVSLQDLVGSFIALLLTVVAANNIPGLLELTIFRRLRLKPGTSFAFTTTLRYLLVVIGIVIAFGLINITWGKVQWIAAAITLGIGFGLQEIFANFVAGLIILFERPIRLGDVVTIGDVSGKVSQIQIRATTIRQFNNRELIVPNKEFITGKLVNWTLSDSILRLEIPVGIAYGSDTEKAKAILLEAARGNPRILTEPAPDVLFDNFGDSSLEFQLRAFVGTVDDLLPAKNELRYKVDAGFREAGIEIAFPQSDIRIRSLPIAGGGQIDHDVQPVVKPDPPSS